MRVLWRMQIRMSRRGDEVQCGVAGFVVGALLVASLTVLQLGSHFGHPHDDMHTAAPRGLPEPPVPQQMAAAVVLETQLSAVTKVSAMTRSQQEPSQWKPCSPATCPIQTKVIVFVLTSPANHARRAAMRQTWLSVARRKQYGMTVRFLVGTSSERKREDENARILEAMKKEDEEHGDLVFLPMVDSYARLTQKLSMALVWAAENVHADYWLKVDDDTYVDVERFFPLLEKKADLGRIYWGYYRANEVMRDPQQMLWYEPNFQLCEKFYVPYALGGGYLLSFELVIFMASIIQPQMAVMLTAEDAWTSMMLTPLDVHRIHDVRFDTSHGKRDCADFYVVLHKNDDKEQLALDEQLRKTPGKHCPKPPDPEGTHMYAYDTHVIPSLATTMMRFKDPDDPKGTDAHFWDRPYRFYPYENLPRTN